MYTLTSWETSEAFSVRSVNFSLTVSSSSSSTCSQGKVGNPMNRDIRPNQTIYVNNLNEKLPRDELRRMLYYLFSQFGPILDINASRSRKMRGQAFICFDDIDSAMRASKEMQNFPFYGKSMRVQFARDKSDVVAHQAGDFTASKTRKERKKNMEDDPKSSSNSSRPSNKRPMHPRDQRGPPGGPRDHFRGPGGRFDPRDQKRRRPLPPMNDAPPNRELFVQGLPRWAKRAHLMDLFGQFHGLEDVRMVDGNHDVAFVDYHTDAESGKAMQALHGFNMGDGCLIRVSFAKR